MRTNIRSYGYFQSLLRTPHTLATVIGNYFDSLIVEKELYDETADKTETTVECRIPTLPGLCYCLGTTVKYLKEYLNSDDRNEEAVHYLNQAVTYIENYLVEEGLRDRLNASLTKFILGAHCETADVNRSGSVSIGSITNNMIQIGWMTPEQVKPGLSLQFDKEQGKLEHIDMKRSFEEDEKKSAGKQEKDDVIDVTFAPVEDDDDWGGLL